MNEKLQELDLSGFTSPDSPELAAYKAEVVKIARAYANRHNWCGVVEQCLREIGALPRDEYATVKVATPLLKLDVRVKVADVQGLTVDKQVAKIIASIGALRLAGNNGNVSGTIAITPEMIEKMEVVQPPKHYPTMGVPTDDENFTFRYVGADARVLHVVRTDHLVATGDLYTLCGAVVDRSMLSTTSRRAEGRVHETCRNSMPTIQRQIQRDRERARPRPIEIPIAV